MQDVQPPNSLKQTLVPGPNQEARSRPGGGGAILERLLGSFVQQPANTKLGAALPPCRNASCAPSVLGGHAPAPTWSLPPRRVPPPVPRLDRDAANFPAPSPPRPRADPPIAEPPLIWGARRGPRLKKTSWLLSSQLPKLQ